MGAFDIILMILIIGGALWLLYYSLWKKKGHCQGGCGSGGCCGKK
jgi:hypothetical protein